MEKTGLEIFTIFKNKQWIFEEDIPILSDYIYGFFDGGSCSNKCTLILTI